MLSRYAWSLVLLCLAAVAQLWCTGLLLLSRQGGALLCGGIVASVFWFWCFWGYLLRKRHIGLILTGLCLVFSVALVALCMLDQLDKSGIFLLGWSDGA